MKTAFVLLLMLTAIFLPGCQKDMDTQPEEELRLDTFDPNAFDFTEWRDCFDEVATAIDSATFAQKWGTPVGRNIWYRSGTKDFLVIPLLKNNLVQNLFVVDSQGQSFTVKKTNILYYEDLEGTGLSKHLLRLFDLEKTELYPTLNLTSIRNKVDDVFTAVNSSGLLKLTEKTPYNLATDSSIRHNSSGLRGIYIEDNCLDYWETYMLDYIVQYINDLAGEQVFVLGEFDGQWYCAFDGNTPFPVDLFLQAGVNCCFQGYCVCPNPQSLFESLVPLMNNYPNTQIRLAMAYFAEVGMEFSVPEQLCLYNNISLTRNVFSLLTNGFNGEINIEDPNLIDIGYTYVEAFCDNSLDNADSFFTYLQNKFSNNP
ncbi:MAG: hypothetical protein KDD49_14105, partial [Bacteroidetes bacterium]|nr:hypothetical protein [Bacteroidota bacterium]